MGMRISILAPIFILLLTGFWSVDEAQASMNKAQTQQYSETAATKPSGNNTQLVRQKKPATPAHRTKQSKSRLAKRKAKPKHVAPHAHAEIKKASAASLMRSRRESPMYHYFGFMSAGTNGMQAPMSSQDGHWLTLSPLDPTGAGRYCLSIGAEADHSPKAAEMVIALAPVRARSEIANAMDENDASELRDPQQMKGIDACLDENSETEPADGLTFKILETAYTYLGVRYRYGGATPEGFDCSGFVRYVFNENGIQLGRSSRDQAREGTHVPLTALKPGDLIFFNMGSRKHHRIDHVGLYIGDGQFIHAASSRSRQIMISDLKSAHYQRRIVTARRVTSSIP